MSLRYLEKAEYFVPGQMFAHIISTNILRERDPKIVRFILESTPTFERVILNEDIDGAEVVEEALNKVYQHNVMRGKAQNVPSEEAKKILYESHIALPRRLQPLNPYQGD